MSDRNFDEYERDEEMLEQRRLRRLEMKRKRKMQQRIILAVIAVVLILAAILIIKGCSGEKPPKELEQEVITPPPVQEEAPKVEPDRMATLAAVGDIMLYDTQLIDAQQEDLSYNFENQKNKFFIHQSLQQILLKT